MNFHENARLPGIKTDSSRNGLTTPNVETIRKPRFLNDVLKGEDVLFSDYNDVVGFKI